MKLLSEIPSHTITYNLGLIYRGVYTVSDQLFKYVNGDIYRLINYYCELNGIRSFYYDETLVTLVRIYGDYPISFLGANDSVLYLDENDLVLYDPFSDAESC